VKISFQAPPHKSGDAASDKGRTMAKGRGRASMARWALGAIFIVTPMVFGLSACSEKALDTGLFGSFTGAEPPVSDNPSPIRAMSGERTDYPTLGSVPPRPTGLTTEAQRQTQMDKLSQDRAASRKRKEATDAIPMPDPLPVPPPPNLQPGRS